jgi:enoyl-[acyl-carrier protein] reductase III
VTDRRKVAVVTGGTRGIGRAISLALAADGMRVLAPYARNRRAAEALEEEARERGLEIVTLRGDLSKEEAFNRTVGAIRERCDRLDVLVHAAATGVHRPAAEITPKHLRFTLETNAVAAHALVRELLPLIPAAGRIVGLTSVGGVRALPTYAAVGASKGALESLFRHWAVELAPRGIAVNLVCPGTVRTEALDAMPDTEERIAAAERGTPTGRLTTPEDVARVVLFLCGDAAAQIVGQTIVVDGGRILSA